MDNYINSEIEKLVKERLTNEEMMKRVKQIVDNSLSIRRGEMYAKSPDGSVTLCARMCTICEDNGLPLGPNIYCYYPWYCNSCSAKVKSTR